MGVITILILTPKYHPIENLVPIQKCDLTIKNGDFTKHHQTNVVSSAKNANNDFTWIYHRVNWHSHGKWPWKIMVKHLLSLLYTWIILAVKWLGDKQVFWHALPVKWIQMEHIIHKWNAHTHNIYIIMYIHPVIRALITAIFPCSDGI